MRVLLWGTGQLGGFAWGRSLDAPGDQRGSPTALSEGHQHLESPEVVGGHKVSQHRAWMLPWELAPQGCGGSGWESQQWCQGPGTQGREARVQERCLQGGWSPQNTWETSSPDGQLRSAGACEGKQSLCLLLGTGRVTPPLMHREEMGALLGQRGRGLPAACRAAGHARGASSATKDRQVWGGPGAVHTHTCVCSGTGVCTPVLGLTLR